jgi:hypothetical protein
MSEQKYTEFIHLNRELLDCYSSIVPNQYKVMNVELQRDFCFAERVRLEETLIKGKISVKDFFAAANAQREQ